MTSRSPETDRYRPNGPSALDFDERAIIDRNTRWFWDPSGCQHVSRYLFARSWVIGRDIVDIACGSGYGSALLARDGRCRVTGIDLSADAIETATAAWSRPNLAFTIGDALDLHMPPGSADTVVSFETIEHVVDPVRFLDQVALLLRPGGRLVLSTPDRHYYSPGAQQGESHNPFHLSEMTRSELLDLLGSRFRVISVFGQTRANSAGVTPTTGPRPTHLVKNAIRRITNPVVGRGRVAEVLLPTLRRNHVPRAAGGSAFAYVVVVCEKPCDP
jgi:SAM-dependent methyltransferase